MRSTTYFTYFLRELKNLSILLLACFASLVSISAYSEQLEQMKISKFDKNEEFLDGGYGWVIVMSTLVQLIILDGLAYSFGIFYIELVERFESSVATTWIFSLQLFMTYGISPVSSVLMSKLGSRVTVMIGSTIAAFGIFSSVFVTKLTQLYLTLGLLTGIGVGILLHQSYIINNYYFSKRRGLANGITNCGTGIGLFVLPALTNYLLDHYGYQGALLILSGVPLQGLICGAVIISPEKIKRKPLKPPSSDDTTLSSKLSISSTIHVNSFSTESVEGSIEKLQEIDVLQRDDKSLKQKLREVIKSAFDVTLFKRVEFTILSLSILLLFLVWHTPFIFLADRAKHYGISDKYGGFLLSALGASCLTSSIVFGFIADLSYLRTRRIYMYSLAATSAGALSVVSFGKSLGQQMVYASIFGMSVGFKFSLSPSVVADTVGVDNMSTASGMIFLLASPITLAGMTLSGWIYDMTQSYEVIYAYSGTCLVISGILPLFIPCIKTLRQRRSKKDREANSYPLS